MSPDELDPRELAALIPRAGETQAPVRAREAPPAQGALELQLAPELKGWTVLPLADPSAVRATVEVAGMRLPERFGGWWRRHTVNEAGEEGPTGEEIVVWLRVAGGQIVLEEVSFRHIADEFERWGVPAMRHMTTMITALHTPEAGTTVAGAVRSTPVPIREQVLQQSQRLRRRNAVTDDRLRRIAGLYRVGGARHIAETESCTETTAYRLVAAARKAGHLPAKGAN